jgi:hypothetical protein
MRPADAPVPPNSSDRLVVVAHLLPRTAMGEIRGTAGADVGSTGINSSATDSRAIGGERTRATATEDSEELPD